MTDIQLPEELPKLDVALRRLRDQTDILNTFEAWYFLFEHYYDENIRDLESESVSQSVRRVAGQGRLNWEKLENEFLIENGLKIELQFEIPYTEDIEKKSVVYKCNRINKEFQGILKLKLLNLAPDISL